MKRLGQVTLFIIIALILVGGLIVFSINRGLDSEVLECQTDADCVPATCCHPDSCVPVSEAPNCAAVSCTANCEPNTLDCEQGGCACINNRCAADWN